ncbi:MAG: type III-B CRISPR module-associated protein Cmr3 [Candidatus Heimdallarchaeum aukensis]|uniref:Type III-B CRISPR module-associated protein Cmr3 n=1 Tax=Candidatus Heimdallarchaeum aukensis TaxID=2876573 RepID=A0A9Y1BLF9_9ARCH|nr:MAG: type III-B CRISPR module-associated protein Cmr3 [Candidatus Heimdallarchaeum aukensis]
MAKEQCFIIEPLDRLFFRGNYSFYKSDSSSDFVKSVFPPSPFSITGLIRSLLARYYGWDGSSKWDENIISKLGDGTDLGPLDFFGPYLLLKEDNQFHPLFPVPLHIIGHISSQKNEEIVDLDYLIPSKQKYLSSISKDKHDRKSILLPRRSGNYGYKTLQNYYVKFDDLERLLSFSSESLKNVRFLSENKLWQKENEIGIEIDPTTNTAVTGNLFSRQMIRLENIVLCMKVNGIDLLDSIENWCNRIGGEGKIANISYKEIEFPVIDKIPPISTVSDNFTITFITPAYLGDSLDEVMTFLSKKFGSEVIGANIGDILRIGGWNAVKKEPLEVRPFIPPGSTFFFDEKNTSSLKRLVSNKIGKLTEFGFGQFLFGKWERGD